MSLVRHRVIRDVAMLSIGVAVGAAVSIVDHYVTRTPNRDAVKRQESMAKVLLSVYIDVVNDDNFEGLAEIASTSAYNEAKALSPGNIRPLVKSSGKARIHHFESIVAGDEAVGGTACVKFGAGSSGSDRRSVYFQCSLDGESIWQLDGVWLLAQ